MRSSEELGGQGSPSREAREALLRPAGFGGLELRRLALLAVLAVRVLAGKAVVGSLVLVPTRLHSCFMASRRCQPGAHEKHRNERLILEPTPRPSLGFGA